MTDAPLVPKAVALVQWLDCFGSSLALIRNYVERTPAGKMTVLDVAEVEEATDRVVSAFLRRWAKFEDDNPEAEVNEANRRPSNACRCRSGPKPDGYFHEFGCPVENPA